MLPEQIPVDNDPPLTPEQVRRYRAMSGGERLELALKMSEERRDKIVAGVRTRHPEYSERQVRMATLLLMQGKEIFEMVYPGFEIVP